MITVPACGSCHDIISLEDEYFMMALGLVLSTAETTHSMFLTSKVKRALARPEAKKLKSALGKGTRKVSVHSEAGIYLGETSAIKFEWHRLKYFAKRVLTGLHYDVQRNIIAEEYDASVFLTWLQGDKLVLESPSIKELLEILAQTKKVVVGNNTLQYWYSIAEDDPNCSFWYIRIAEEFGFFGIVSPKKRANKT
jgi:hypothetical protein